MACSGTDWFSKCVTRLLALSLVAGFTADRACAKVLAADTTMPLHHLTVAIKTEFSNIPPKQGFGMIVGTEGNTVYIATPNHVVREPDSVLRIPGHPDYVLQWKEPTSITVFFYDINRSKGRAVLCDDLEENLDLAFIKVVPDRPLDKLYFNILAHKRMYRRDKVWYLGKWESDEPVWYVPDVAGRLLVPDTAKTLIAHGLDVKKGRSGAPLFVDSGAVGLIVSTDGGVFSAIPMEAVKRFARRRDDLRFSLMDYEWFSNAPKWYLGGGLGPGWGSVNGDESLGGVAYSARAAWGGFGDRLLREWTGGFGLNMLLGLDIDYFSATDEFYDDEFQQRFRWSYDFINFSPAVTWYPTQSFFVRMGPAVSVLTVYEDLYWDERDTEWGLGYSVGTAYHLRLGEHWALNPTYAHAYQKFDMEFVDISVHLNLFTCALLYIW